MIYLLCQWSNAGGAPPCGAVTTTIQISGAGLPGANQNYKQLNATQWQGITDPTIGLFVIGGQWLLLSLNDPDQYFASLSEFPCTWHLGQDATGPAPSGQYVCTIPIAPVDLGASAGDGQVTLTWPAGVGATGYNIKRALVPGGPYAVIGTSAASPYVDHTSANGTTYYYVVSSTNACGESLGNSLESHATPTPAVPSVVILPDGSGGFWKVILSINGDVYLQSDPGPATPDVILADGGGGFWKLTASVAGDRYGVSNAGPATVAPVILDSNLVAWTLTVDILGDITATS